MSRRERQRIQILLLARRGEFSRAVALGREHLTEFTDDDEVAAVVDRSALGKLALVEQGEDIG